MKVAAGSESHQSYRCPASNCSVSVQPPRDANAVGSAGHGASGSDLSIAALELLDRGTNNVLDVTAADDDGTLVELAPFEAEGAV